MALDEEMQRQAVMHGVADAIAGVTRLQIAGEVYDEQYWDNYRAGLAAWAQAEAGADLGTWYRPEPVRAAPVRQPSAASPDDGRPFATRMLDHLLASGECVLMPTVLEDYAASRMAEIGRGWAADPPEGFRNGPEAG